MAHNEGQKVNIDMSNLKGTVLLKDVNYQCCYPKQINGNHNCAKERSRGAIVALSSRLITTY